MVCNSWDYSIICLSGSYPIKATIEAWSSNFKGDAAAVLLATISDYLDKKRECYARLASIVNSSGTGKSRMVDQISTKIITVPMCLREDGTRGLARGVLLISVFLWFNLNRISSFRSYTTYLASFSCKPKQARGSYKTATRFRVLATKCHLRPLKNHRFWLW